MKQNTSVSRTVTLTHGARNTALSTARHRETRAFKDACTQDIPARDGLLPPGIGLVRRVWKEPRLPALQAAGVKTPQQSSRTLLLLHLFRAVKEGADEPEGERGRVGVHFFWLIAAPWLTHRFIIIFSGNAQLCMSDKLCSWLSGVHIIHLLRQFGKGLRDWPCTSFYSFLTLPRIITEVFPHLWGNIIRGNLI